MSYEYRIFEKNAPNGRKKSLKHNSITFQILSYVHVHEKK